MSWLRSGSCLLSAALSSGCDHAPRLQVLGDSTRLAESESSPTTSAIFDGKVVHLRAARGETLGLSARLQADSLRPVQLLLPPEGAVVTGFAVRALGVGEASTSMYGKSRGTGSYPDVLEPAKGSEPTGKLTYFDVAIPRGTSPGQYRGRLLVGERDIPVALEVSSATIDLTLNPLVWVFYLPGEIARAHGLPDVDTPELIEKERAYHELFRAHGAFLAADLPPARLGVRRRFIHDVKYWPVAIDSSSDAAIERDVHSWLALFRDTGVTPFAIPVDEPRAAAARERARHVAEVIGRAGGGRPGLLRAVTDAWAPSYGDAMDVYLSPLCFPKQALERTGLGERFWTYNGRPPGAGSMILDTDGVALRTWGWIAQRYDIELWHAWEGLYFSDRYNRGGPTDVLHDPLTFDERSSGGSDFGNGDGLLAYPGPLPSLRLKALRRGLQDRLLLRELASCGGAETANRIVRRVVPRALGEAGEEASWSLEEPAWERARYEVLDAIERECHGQAVLAH
jgi:Domain of unknown function (DUF4091)